MKLQIFNFVFLMRTGKGFSWLYVCTLQVVGLHMTWVCICSDDAAYEHFVRKSFSGSTGLLRASPSSLLFLSSLFFVVFVFFLFVVFFCIRNSVLIIWYIESSYVFFLSCTFLNVQQFVQP